ncbi:NlpC/P60 family protein [Pyruvatibacter sp.]|uniref:C40 family peptidase n=1 Tax=Pyruvatibacter sp. TaxID=1981328 RepID=UPI0032EDCFAE
MPQPDPPQTMQETLDPRVNAFRPDLARATLEGRVAAPRFVTGTPACVTVPVTALRRTPAPDGPRDTELLFGESVVVLDEAQGWAWVQADRDRYVGYVAGDTLARHEQTPTHRVAALRTFIYAAANLKSPVLGWMSLNSPVQVISQQDRFSLLSGGGCVFTDHLHATNETAPDFVGVAEGFLETPYLWGGRSSLGLDCSALVQCALEAAGIECPRDTDMQESAVGIALAETEPMQRGDLVFWKGHVGIMRDARTLLHANATHMKTVLEPVELAIRRIAETDGPVTSVRRLPSTGKR